jgi:DNA-binding LacI/PurR family transcriptional regulator
MATNGNQPAPHGTVTLADVAEHVGVSARTVSRVVNDQGGCTAETRDRILAAIEELGYRPNLMARGLIKRRSDTIGLVSIAMLDPFFPEFADGVERAARDLGRTMFLASTGGDRERQQRALTSMVGHGVDGAIVFPAAHAVGDLVEFAAKEIPIVVINDEAQGVRISSVSAEIRAGAEMAVNHLLRGGRQRVAALLDRGARNAPRPSRREVGYHNALEAAGFAPDRHLIIDVDNSLEGGRVGLDEALARPNPPDALFAYNDLIAIGALQRALEIGISVPDDLAIVGFDDIEMCQAMTPTLTSVRIDRDQLGRVAVDMIRTLVEDGSVPSRRLPVELVVRDSAP